jgi:hypothetical protein
VLKSPTNDQRYHLSALRDCRETVLADLTLSVSEVLANVEDALVNFLDKADSNQSKFRFIDAISAFRGKRDSVQPRFREEIARGFTEFRAGKPISYPLPILEPQFESQGSLTLLEDTELDQRLSLQIMIDKAERTTFHRLYALKRRLALVRGGTQLMDRDIPAGPTHIASAFQIAAAHLDFDGKILLILYALFDKFVMQRLDDLYIKYNQLLIDAGAFPNLEYEATATPQSQRGTARESGEIGGQRMDKSERWRARATAARKLDVPSTLLGEELFNSIRNLMAIRRIQDPRHARYLDVRSKASDAAAVVDKPTLARAIDDLQPAHGADYLPRIGATGRGPAGVRLDESALHEARQRLLEGQQRLSRGVGGKAISTVELDIIELVGMLFEQVLNEEDLPNIAKALISHLHTPYLKVAVLDRSFLTDPEHAARRLLNLMVDAGCLWIEESDLGRGVYYSLQEDVNRILAEFRDDMRVFEDVLKELTRQMAELEQKAKVLETRSKEAARGKERLESARLHAGRLVKERIGDRRFAPLVDRFLRRAWLDRMILMMLRTPNVEDSMEWEETLAVIDDIVRIHESRGDPVARAEALERLPGLRCRIEEGLASMGSFHQPDLQALFDLLKSYAGTDAKPEGVAVESPRRHPPSPGHSEQPTGGTVAEKTKLVPVDAEPLNTEEQTIVESLEKLKFGTWFELEGNDGNLRRLKLAWYSPVSRQYMFVGKSGAKALVIPIDHLARKLAKGEAKMLRRSALPFVDRALKAVLAFLQMPLREITRG